MFKTMVRGLAAMLLCGSLAGCPSTTPVTPTVCSLVATAQANPTAQQAFASVGSTSVIGVLWADLQSGCTNGQPASGVDASWTQSVLTMLEQALPQYLPLLVGLI